MKIGIKVGDVMTRDIISVNPSADLVKCAQEMYKQNVGLLIVKNKNQIMGMLTEKEIIWALTKKQDLKRIKAKDIMLRKLTTIKPSRDIYDALLRMKKNNIRWLPITIKKNIVGLLTINDILKVEPALFEIVHGNFKIKELEDKISRKSRSLNGESWTSEGECEKCKAIGLLYDTEEGLLCENCANEYERKNFQLS